MFVLALCAGIFLAACSQPDTRAPQATAEGDPGPVDMEKLRHTTKNFQQFIDALLLCGSLSPRDWEDARRRFEVLHPFSIFREDPDLIRQFRSGSEDARKELARRGMILQALLVFQQKYDKARWDEARKTLMESEPGQALLATTLLKMLLNIHFQEVWTYVRFTLVESGPMALATTVGLAEELMRVMPGETPVFKGEDLTQALLVIIGFGDAGQSHLETFSKSGKPNVRRTVARAIGEAMDDAAVPILIRLLTDPEWTVRTSAAEAMGRMAPARAQAGPALVARIHQERDGTVLRTVLRAIGDLLYADGVPDLIRMVEVPNHDTAKAAMSALYIITGERFLRREQWTEWYRTKYPAWKRKQPAK
jgi:hypothetical protein